MDIPLLFLLLYFLPSSSLGADPPGHMQPLGSHRDPELVPQLSHIPTPLEFMEEYVLASRPVVLEGLLSGSDLLNNWQQDSYLRAQFGDEEVIVEHGKKENRSGEAVSLTMAQFLDRYEQDDVYLVSVMPDSMAQEWLLPRFLLCGGYTNNLMYIYLWFSSGGTRSVLHTDTYENLHCLVSGRKEFVLFEPKYSKDIGPEHEDSGFYHIDVDRVDMTAYPGLVDMPWHLATVNPGDCLYLPYSWIHHVRSHGRNFGVNVWWIPFEFQTEDCVEDVPDFAPLGNFQITPELQLKQALREHAWEDGTVHVEDMHKMMNKDDRMAGVRLDNIKKLFDLLEPGCNGVLHSSRLESIPLERYTASFQYIMKVHEEIAMSRSKQQETDFSDEGEFGGYGDYDFEDPEYSEGGGDFQTPTWQRKDEL